MNSLKMIELSLTDVVIRMALAVVFGALIGLERSIKRKGFGISSNAILCLASCTISILQIQSVDILVDVVKQNSALASIISMDITRYGAQVISGVGFLGAGIIVFRERKVSGLTTAVMMWNVTIIGLVIGMGFLTIAFINLVATLLVLALAHFKRKTPLKRLQLIVKMKEPMIKESRLHEQLQDSLEKGERLVELTLESEQEAVTAKISYVGKEDFWHSNLHHLLKEKGHVQSVCVTETI